MIKRIKGEPISASLYTLALEPSHIYGLSRMFGLHNIKDEIKHRLNAPNLKYGFGDRR